VTIVLIVCLIPLGCTKEVFDVMWDAMLYGEVDEPCATIETTEKVFDSRFDADWDNLRIEIIENDEFFDRYFIVRVELIAEVLACIGTEVTMEYSVDFKKEHSNASIINSTRLYFIPNYKSCLTGSLNDWSISLFQDINPFFVQIPASSYTVQEEVGVNVASQCDADKKYNWVRGEMILDLHYGPFHPSNEDAKELIKLIVKTMKIKLIYTT